MLELNRNPENYFAGVEQAAFNPANVVPGISFSPDEMLQGRLFSYGDAQRYRLGVNHHLIPVNKEQQEALFGNTAWALGDPPMDIKVRHIGNCSKADPEYGKGVAAALGIPMSDVPM